jgi:hypothetical protein
MSIVKKINVAFLFSSLCALALASCAGFGAPAANEEALQVVNLASVSASDASLPVDSTVNLSGVSLTPLTGSMLSMIRSKGVSLNDLEFYLSGNMTLENRNTGIEVNVGKTADGNDSVVIFTNRIDQQLIELSAKTSKGRSSGEQIITVDQATGDVFLKISFDQNNLNNTLTFKCAADDPSELFRLVATTETNYNSNPYYPYSVFYGSIEYGLTLPGGDLPYLYIKTAYRTVTTP